jgi:hypothetical protein
MVMVPNRSVGRHERRAEQGGGGRVAETGRRIWTQCGQEENLLAARFRPFMVAAAAVRSAAGICSGQCIGQLPIRHCWCDWPSGSNLMTECLTHPEPVLTWKSLIHSIDSSSKRYRHLPVISVIGISSAEYRTGNLWGLSNEGDG